MKGKLALVFGILVGCSGFVSAQPYYPIGAAPSADAQQVHGPPVARSDAANGLWIRLDREGRLGVPCVAVGAVRCRLT